MNPVEIIIDIIAGIALRVGLITGLSLAGLIGIIILIIRIAKNK